MSRMGKQNANPAVMDADGRKTIVLSAGGAEEPGDSLGVRNIFHEVFDPPFLPLLSILGF